MFGQKSTSGNGFKVLKIALLIILMLAINIVTSVGVVLAGSNNFTGWVVSDNAAGSAASPASAGFGFIRAAGGSAPTGPSIRIGTGTPNGVTTGVKGSEWIRTDSSGQHYYNTDGGTTWVLVTTS